MSRVIVTDTGPLIHLAQINLLTLLELPGEIIIPQTVIDELNQRKIDIAKLEYTIEHVDIDIESVYPQLDAGETAAITLCTNRDAVLVTDDLEARRIAKQDGIEVHGSIGIILFGFSSGEMSETETIRYLRGLAQESSLYLSQPLIQHAIELVETEYDGW